MGYQVAYVSAQGRNIVGKRLLFVMIMTIWFLLGFCILVKISWPQGAEVLRRILLTDEWWTMVSSMEYTVQQTGIGERIWDILTVLRNQLHEWLARIA